MLQMENRTAPIMESQFQKKILTILIQCFNSH